MACGEAMANAVEHAFPDGGGELTVELWLAAEHELTVRVADTGRWRRCRRRGTGAAGCR